jgi:S1-C subfamily serine protease
MPSASHLLFAGGTQSEAGAQQTTASSPLVSNNHANPVENSVVKIFATVRYPDLSKPWSMRAPEEVTGSGVVIEGKRILSNAHVVLYASQVQIQTSRAGDKISATLEAAAPGIDLAVL